MLGSVREQVYRETWKPGAPERKECVVGGGRGRHGNLVEGRGGKKERLGSIVQWKEDIDRKGGTGGESL